MTTFEAIILGCVQGLTEFLPVSSSGHNVLAAHLLGLDFGLGEAAAVNVLMHLGSLIAIVVVFWKDIIGLVRPRIDWNKIGLIAMLSVPAAIVGFGAKDWLEARGYFDSPTVVLCGLVVTSLMLILAERQREERIQLETVRGRDFWLAILIGFGQALALTPGISRSGTTVALALMLGWVRSDAVRLSFLMGMIAIGGAGLLEARHISDIDVVPALAGLVSSLVFSFMGLIGLKYVVRERKLRWFAAYTLAVALVGGAWLLFGSGAGAA